MTLLALVLGCLGAVDLVRWQDERIGRRAGLGLAVGGALTLLLLVAGGAGALATAWTTAVVVLLAVIWVVASSRSLRDTHPTWPGLVAGLGILGTTIALSPLAPALGGALGRWYAQLPVDVVQGVPLERFLVVVGCALLLTGTGNLLVRLVLTAAGSKVKRSEQQIKGGRVLGPMERLLIFGLGMAGQLTAAAIVVAAKGLLRFPELQSYRADPPADDDEVQRIDVLTEYFLIGSMTSWLLALACLVLV